MNGYSLNVPVTLKLVNAGNRPKYLEMLKKAGAERIFLVVNQLSDRDGIDWKLLEDDIRYFSENGIEAVVWFGETLGHGCYLSGIGMPDGSGKQKKFTNIRGITGAENKYSFCPLDREFSDFFCDNIRKAAASGAKLIIIDDDFRLSLRDYGIGCACPLHMKRISELLGGEKITHEKLTECVIHGKPNRWRDAWIRAQGDSLRSLAVKIRQACDSVDPSVRIGIMDCYTLWDVDGVTADELSVILAGNAGKPFIRVSGAPYWGYRRDPDLPGVFEITSLHMSFISEKSGGEYIGEGDTYPRPRYLCPAAYMTLHDAFLRAEGSLEGNLMFLFNFTSSPDYEKGYTDAFVRLKDKLNSFGRIFAGGERTGVRIFEYRSKMRNAVFPENEFDGLSVLPRYPYPHGGIMTATAGIPTVYTGDQDCGVVFGENARHISAPETKSGLVIDASAAMILKERGIDVGIDEILSFDICNVDSETFVCDRETVCINDGRARLLRAELSADAVIESTAATDRGNAPLSYRYRNRAGQCFLVFLFDGLELSRTTGLLFTYSRKEQLVSAFDRFGSEKLPVVLENRSPFVYLLTKKTEEGLAVGVFNCFSDEVISPSFRVADNFTGAEFKLCSGRLLNGRVTLDGDIPPFGFAAFILK